MGETNDRAVAPARTRALVSTNAPSLQKAIETTIPTLSGLMLGFIGALFVAAAITDVAAMGQDVSVRPFFTETAYTLPLARRYLVMLGSAVAALCFYKSIVECVWSQMSSYDPDGSLDALTPSAEELKDATISVQWEAFKSNWATQRAKHARSGLKFFNLGQQFLFLPLVFLLPPNLLAPGLVLWILSWLFYYLRTRKQ